MDGDEAGLASPLPPPPPLAEPRQQRALTLPSPLEQGDSPRLRGSSGSPEAAARAVLCGACGAHFGVVTRRHHCRRCGGAFCGPCSEGRWVLAGQTGPQRVCNACAARAPSLPSSPCSGLQPGHALERPWQGDGERSSCSGCDEPFSMMRRRHHCRMCCQLFCNDCCNRREHVAGFRGTQRVCTSCLARFDRTYCAAPFWTAGVQPGGGIACPESAFRPEPAPAGHLRERLAAALGQPALEWLEAVPQWERGSLSDRAAAQHLRGGLRFADAEGELLGDHELAEKLPPELPPARAGPAERQLPRAWVVLGDSVSCLGVTQRDMVRLLRKLDYFAAHRGDSLFQTWARLDLRDFRALALADELAQHFHFYAELEDTGPTAALFRPLGEVCHAVGDQTDLRAAALEGYEDGDVLFYDMRAREALGEMDLSGIAQQAFVRIQQKYDRYSHSGLFVTMPWQRELRPAIFHSVGSRNKVIRLTTSWACIPKREVDFAKVFGDGWHDLTAQEREEAVLLYKSAVRQKSEDASRILNPCSETLGMISIARKPARALESLDADPYSTWKLTWDERLAPPGGAPHVMCSGFTASILLEVWAEMAAHFAREAAARRESDPAAAGRLGGLQLQPGLFFATLRFSPLQLHVWPVWRDALERPPGLLRFAAKDVHEGFEGLAKLQSPATAEAEAAARRARSPVGSLHSSSPGAFSNAFASAGGLQDHSPLESECSSVLRTGNSPHSVGPSWTALQGATSQDELQT